MQEVVYLDSMGLEDRVFKNMAARLKRAVELEREFAGREGVIQAGPHSRDKVPFFPDGRDDDASRSYKSMSIAVKARIAMQVLPNIVTSTRAAKNANRDFANNPDSPKQEAPPEFIQELEQEARKLTAGQVGYTALQPNHIFKECAVLYPNVIILMMEMDQKKIAKGPGIGTYIMIHDTYARLSEVTLRLTDFIREHGYGAQAGPPMGGVTIYPVLAQKANLGWCGAHGILITPEFGPRIRLAAIYTSISNLPAPEPAQNPHQWIGDFCRACRKCIRTCPGSAIHDEPIVHPDGGLTCTDVVKCRPYFQNDFGCTICLRDCPFSKTAYDKVKAGHSRRGKSDEVSQ